MKELIGVLRTTLCKEDWHETMFDWLTQLCRWERFDEFIDIQVWSKEKVDVYFYTKSNRYHIVGIVKKDYTYLGCTVTNRKPRAGEKWNRGNDLPDGEFVEDVWNKILMGIVKYEGVKIAKRQRYRIDKVNESVEGDNATEEACEDSLVSR